MSESGSGAPAAMGNLGQVGMAGKAPSLFSGREAKSDRQPEKVSILSAMDRGGVSGKSGRQSGRRGLLVFVGLLLAFTVVIAARWALSEDVSERVVEAPPAVQQQSAPVLPIAAAGNPSQAATIENVSPASLADDSVSAGTRTSTEPEAKSVQVGNAPSPETEDRLPLAALAAPTSEPKSQPSATSLGNGTRAASTSGFAKRTQSRVAEKGKSTLAPDNDATLLAALVAHESGTPIEVKPVTASVAKEKGGTSTKRDSSTARKRNTAFDPKRDVVEDDKNVPTAELIQRCGTLGLIEGFLCKMRVCSNRQGGDPACPQPVEPTAKGD